MDDDNAPLPLPPLGLRHDVERLERLPWRIRLMNAALTYLPLLLMALLALATWWLVQQTPEPEPERASAPLRHEPDYEMRGFSVRHHTLTGPSAAVIEGEHVRHYTDTDTLEIDRVRLRWRDAAGRETEAVADHAIARTDGSALTLDGRVIVRSHSGDGEPFEFRGEQLQVDARNQRMRSDRPVQLVQGRSRFDAGSIDYDHPQQSLLLGRSVQGVLGASVMSR